MPAYNERRQRLYVDANVQRDLLRHLLSYWLMGLATLVMVILIYRIAPYWLSGNSQLLVLIWHDLSPLIVVSLAISPIIIISVLRFSNRFVGPMLRFRQTIRLLAEGKTPPQIELRKEDYWRDIADDLNQVSALLANTRSDDQGEAPSDLEELVKMA